MKHLTRHNYIKQNCVSPTLLQNVRQRLSLSPNWRVFWTVTHQCVQLLLCYSQKEGFYCNQSYIELCCAGSGETCGVREALKALASRCCRPATSDAIVHVSNCLIALTPLSLALAIVSAAARVAGIIGAHRH